jgi:hypothetical protein
MTLPMNLCAAFVVSFHPLRARIVPMNPDNPHPDSLPYTTRERGAAFRSLLPRRLGAKVRMRGMLAERAPVRFVVSHGVGGVALDCRRAFPERHCARKRHRASCLTTNDPFR